MPLTTTTVETRKIIGGAQCLSRHYPNGCPHEVGTNLLLAFEKPDKTMQPYAHARVMAIAVLPMGTRSVDGLGGKLAEGEGYEDVDSWAHHFRGMYGKITEDTEVTRLQLTIRLLDGTQPVAQQSPRELDQDPNNYDIPKVEKVKLELSTGKTKTVGSVGNLDAVAELETQMFGK